MGRAVILLANRAKPEVVAALAEVRRLIGAHGRIVGEFDASEAALPENPASLIKNGADLIVVLGGDGTLLAQSRRCVSLGLPMLGVNLGRLGFMAEFDVESLRDQARSLFNGDVLELQDRPLLHVEVFAGGGGEGATPRFQGLALNDAVITAGPPFRMISMSLSINGEDGPNVSGDGMIISTPTGSTAYNVSAGGSILAPEVNAFAITPIAAHSLAFRPIIVSAGSIIELVMSRVNDNGISATDAASTGAWGTTLVLDGQASTPLHEDDRLRLKKHPQPIRFVRNPKGSYWKTLIQKMHWGAAPRLRGPS